MEITDRQRLKIAEAHERFDVRSAIRDYVELSDSPDAYVAFWANRNAAYLIRDSGDLSSAIVYAETAWRLESAIDVGLLLVSLYRDMQKFEEAVCILNQVQTDNPDDPNTHVSRGDLAISMGLPIIQALGSYGRAATLSPSHYWAKRNYGVCLRRLGDPTGAIRELSAARELSEDDSLLLELGDAYFDLGDNVSSRAIFQKLSEYGDDIVGGALSRFYDEDCGCDFVNGWVASKLPLKDVHLSISGRRVRTFLTEAPNPFARRWEGSNYIFLAGFAAYFNWENGEETIELGFLELDQVKKSVLPLARRDSFRTEPDQSRPSGILPAGTTFSDVASQLWRQSRFRRVIHYLYGKCALEGTASISGVSADIIFMLARALLHEHRYAEAERVCLALVHARNSLSSREASHAVELYCYSRSIRCECTVGLAEMKACLRSISERDRDIGRPGALVNLGHLAALDRDFTAAQVYYNDAIDLYPGLPLEFNRSIYAFAELGMKASSFIDQNSTRSEFPPPIFINAPNTPELDIVHFIACDSNYFRRFVPALVSSAPNSNGMLRVGLHVHIVNPTMENLLTLASLSKHGGYQHIAISIEQIKESMPAEVKHAYYTTPRFLHAADVMSIYTCPILITETDCVINWSWSDLLDWAKRGEVGLMFKEVDRTLPLGAKVVAQSVYLDGSPVSIEFIRSVASYIRAGFKFDSMFNWTIDQLALWTSYEHLRQRAKFFNLDRDIIKVPDLDKDLFVQQVGRSKPPRGMPT